MAQAAFKLIRYFDSPTSVSSVLGLQACAIPPHLIYVVRGIKPRVQCVLGKHHTN